MRILVTGGSGVLGRALRPAAEAAGHELRLPARSELDLFDPRAVAAATRDADAVLHLATRIPAPERMPEPAAWRENDRLRAEASRLLVDAALGAGAEVYVQPSVTFVYPEDDAVSEETPVTDVSDRLQSALVAEQQAARFAGAGRRGVVLRLGLLDGPAPATRSPTASTTPRCTSPTPPARCLRRSRSQAGPTTSAATTSASPTAACRRPPAGDRSIRLSPDPR